MNNKDEKTHMKNNLENTHVNIKDKNTSEQNIVILVVIITAFITTFTGSALNLSIPDIGEQFGVSANFCGLAGDGVYSGGGGVFRAYRKGWRI